MDDGHWAFVIGHLSLGISHLSFFKNSNYEL